MKTISLLLLATSIGLLAGEPPKPTKELKPPGPVTVEAYTPTDILSNQASYPTPPLHVLSTGRVIIPSPPPALEYQAPDGMARTNLLESVKALTNDLAFVTVNGTNILRLTYDFKIFAHGKYLGQVTTNAVPGWLPVVDPAPPQPNMADLISATITAVKRNPDVDDPAMLGNIAIRIYNTQRPSLIRTKPVTR